ncbi:hypothetical protein HO133_009706 [Letharia lupina]|uniref:NADAR domain-containing protein n=1 Tax=Letharia lupina TaxID=560253 RepID=A0A8H6CM80_9LECA|nr:uncharacterized protein HO133_009706 [Letharia lupina]KAF6225706.1 hypothetical protein HO133_009706 [Letharia lupina]
MASSTISSTGGPVFFWREFESPYGFLSQWYPSAFTAPSSTGTLPMTFVTAEQYMMYHKAILFDNQDVADEIALEPEPSKQRALGREVKGFDGKKWNAKREKVVEEGNWWKFTQSKEGDPRKMLLETGDRLLVEASPYDKIWGVGYSAANAAANEGNWGENLLGKALMRVRDRLRSGEDNTTDEISTNEKV